MIVTPIVGAVIGLFTNALAIAMLFRPHKRLRIFGINIPFTPGIIPRQRQQLARKMGQTISLNVLTSQSLIEAAQKTAIIDNIAKIVENLIDKAMASDKTIADFLKSQLNFSQSQAEELAKKIVDKALEYAKDTACQKALPYIKSRDFAQILAEFAKSRLLQLEKSDKKIIDIIPPAAIQAIKSLAYNNMHKIAPAARKFLQDENIDTRLRKLVAQIAKENAGGLLSIFVNSDKIYDSITQNLLKYLDDKENHILLYEKLEGFLDSQLNRGVGPIFAKLDETAMQTWLANAIAALQNDISHEHIEKFFDKISPKLSQGTLPAVGYLLNIAPGRQLRGMGLELKLDNYKASINSAVKSAVGVLAKKAGEHIIAHLDIAKIAEDKINDFDIAKMERLLLDVVGKHLGWIVLLGGALGFLMGLAPAIISLF